MNISQKVKSVAMAVGIAALVSFSSGCKATVEDPVYNEAVRRVGATATVRGHEMWLDNTIIFEGKYSGGDTIVTIGGSEVFINGLRNMGLKFGEFYEVRICHDGQILPFPK